MPSLRSLRILCDKMKNMSSTMTICCISSGDLSFIVETDSAVVVSRYFNLMPHNGGKKKLSEESCEIDTKTLSSCFGSIQVRILYNNQLDQLTRSKQCNFFFLDSAFKCNNGWNNRSRKSVRY